MDNALFLLLIFSLAAYPLSTGATGRLLRVLRARNVLDRPNERSSHSVPTPRGGGLALLGVALPLAGAALLLMGTPAGPLWFLLLALALVLLSFLDDLRPLGAGVRLLAHLTAATAGLFCLPDATVTLGGLIPAWLGAATVPLAWVWFINLYNFMDGIDGLAGVETVSLGGGIALVGALAADPPLWNWLALGPILAASALGFLRWNWHPARLFLGDAGSIPLGFLLGGLLLALAAQGELLAALILPAAYVADATYTLLARLRRGCKVWEAHREHFYQRAVQGGWPHDRVARAFALTNLGLIACAATSVLFPTLGLPAAVAAAAAVGGLLFTLARAGHRPAA